ncbi:hypothetical protein ACFL52_03380, partial [Candidatus Margulisiibacteriota bacterium]
ASLFYPPLALTIPVIAAAGCDSPGDGSVAIPKAKNLGAKAIMAVGGGRIVEKEITWDIKVQLPPGKSIKYRFFTENRNACKNSPEGVFLKVGIAAKYKGVTGYKAVSDEKAVYTAEGYKDAYRFQEGALKIVKGFFEHKDKQTGTIQNVVYYLEENYDPQKGLLEKAGYYKADNNWNILCSSGNGSTACTVDANGKLDDSQTPSTYDGKIADLKNARVFKKLEINGDQPVKSPVYGIEFATSCIDPFRLAQKDGKAIELADPKDSFEPVGCEITRADCVQAGKGSSDAGADATVIKSDGLFIKEAGINEAGLDAGVEAGADAVSADGVNTDALPRAADGYKIQFSLELLDQDGKIIKDQDGNPIGITEQYLTGKNDTNEAGFTLVPPAHGLQIGKIRARIKVNRTGAKRDDLVFANINGTWEIVDK